MAPVWSGPVSPTAANLKDNDPDTPLTRLAEMRTPYGYLLNMLASRQLPGNVIRDPSEWYSGAYGG